MNKTKTLLLLTIALCTNSAEAQETFSTINVTGSAIFGSTSSFYNTINNTQRLTINQTSAANPRLYNYDESTQTFHSIKIGGNNSDNSGSLWSGSGHLTQFGIFTHTKELKSKGSTYTHTWMKFKQAQHGNSLILGAGGLTAIGAGESANHINTKKNASEETLYLTSDNGHKIITNLQSGWGSRVEAVVISKQGEVSINSASPSTAFTVAGTISSREIVVEETAGADFVFEENYDLPSLAEIESFIQVNKHLPGIAPASQMIEEGVKVGEFQIQLLQKIEELTLHMIQQNKVNQQQMQLIDDQSEMIKALNLEIEKLRGVNHD